MKGEIVRNARRTVPLDIARRSADDAARVAKPFGDQRTVGQRAHADGHVSLLGDEVNDIVREAQVDGEIGMARAKRGNRRHPHGLIRTEAKR